MNIEVHPSVIKVAEFMQNNFETSELLPIAEAIGLIAPALWGHYEAGIIVPLSLTESPLLAANGLSLDLSDAGDGSVAA